LQLNATLPFSKQLNSWRYQGIFTHTPAPYTGSSPEKNAGSALIEPVLNFVVTKLAHLSSQEKNLLLESWSCQRKFRDAMIFSRPHQYEKI